MGKQIIKQPNGLYCIFSTISDNYLLTNANKDQIIDYHVNERTRSIKAEIGKLIDSIENGEKPYFQFTLTFEDTIDIINNK